MLIFLNNILSFLELVEYIKDCDLKLNENIIGFIKFIEKTLETGKIVQPEHLQQLESIVVDKETELIYEYIKKKMQDMLNLA